MWTSTDKTFNDCPMFFQFSRENEFFVISFTNLKQYFSTKINNTAFTSSINSVSNLQSLVWALSRSQNPY